MILTPRGWLLRSGTEIPADGGLLALDPVTLDLCASELGDAPATPELNFTSAERAELAAHMVTLWLRWSLQDPSKEQP